MKIVGAYLNNWIRTGGQRRYLELMAGLAQRGHEVIILMRDGFGYSTGPARRLDIPFKRSRRLGESHSLWYRRLTMACWPRLVHTLSGVDWIHVHGETHWPLALQMCRRLEEAKIFFAIRSNKAMRNNITMKANRTTVSRRIFLLFRNLKYHLNERRIAKFASLIAFQSGVDEADFLKHAPKGGGKTVVIPGAIDGPRFRPEYRDSNRSTGIEKIVYVGLVDATKGIEFLLRGFADALERSGAELSLDVLGRGSRVEESQRLAEKLGIRGRVTFHGQVSDPFPFIQQADLMVYPTLYDAFPDVVLEALHVGTPVIASRCGGIPDILHHDELLFAIMDSKDIADKIVHAVSDASQYLLLKRLCAGRRVPFIFDWAKAWEQAMVNHGKPG